MGFPANPEPWFTLGKREGRFGAVPLWRVGPNISGGGEGTKGTNLPGRAWGGHPVDLLKDQRFTGVLTSG